jgi:hypothetical protein
MKTLLFAPPPFIRIVTSPLPVAKELTANAMLRNTPKRMETPTLRVMETSSCVLTLLEILPGIVIGSEKVYSCQE